MMAQPVDEDVLYSSDAAPDGERVRQLDGRQNAVREYGGFYWGSDFIGFVVASFFTLLLFGIVGAVVGTVGYQMGAPVPKVGGAISNTTQTLGIAGLVGGLVALFIAYFIGGYTAGRMARFDGARNGVGVVIWTIVVAIVLGIIGAALGNRFNVGSQLHLNINTSTLTTAGLVSLAVTLIVMLLAAILGGSMGARYHRAIDRDLGVAR
jgi:MFS family permease